MNKEGKEPTAEEIEQYMKANNENYYNARERLREKAYGGEEGENYNAKYVPRGDYLVDTSSWSCSAVDGDKVGGGEREDGDVAARERGEVGTCC